MIYRKLIILFTLVAGLMAGCSEDNEEDLVGNWVVRSDFDGYTRANSVSFVIGDYAYVGTGFNSNDEDYYTDFWRYDPELNFWQRMADFPGVGRSSAVAFAIGNKGYVGTGFDGDDELKDFWEYNPATNQWTQLADFGGSARRGAAGFAVGGKGYILTGYDGSNLKDAWEFNPTTNAWTQIPSIGGSKRVNAFTFVIDDKAYLGGGSNNGIYETDFWEFDPVKLESDEFPWVQLTDLDDDDDYSIYREYGATFTMNGLGYVATGSNGYAISTVWQYNPGTDIWEEKTEFEGTARTEAVGFSIGNRGFVALGRNSTTFLDDIWQFFPNETYDEDD